MVYSQTSLGNNSLAELVSERKNNPTTVNRFILEITLKNFFSIKFFLHFAKICQFKLFIS